MTRLDDDPFDPARLRLNVPTVSPTLTAKSAKAKGEYALIPMSWFEAMRGTSVGAHRLAIYLLHRKFKHHSGTFRLPNGKDLGISRFAKYRALRELEAIGLATVDKRTGKPPTVTLVDP